MKTKYSLVFYYVSKWNYPLIKSENDLYSCVSNLSSFSSINQLKFEIIPFAREVLKGTVRNNKEWMEPSENFIRIDAEKVQFGHYVDENLAELEEFKDHLPEGEKIFGEVVTKDFIEIAEAWLIFLETGKIKTDEDFNEVC
jgi:hypothetical protein